MITDEASFSGRFRERKHASTMRQICSRISTVLIALAVSGALAITPGCAAAMAQEAAADAAASSAKASPADTPAPAADSGQGDRVPDKARAAAMPAASDSARPRRAKAKNKRDSATSANAGESAGPFGSFDGTANRGPVNIQSDSLSLDYKQTTTTFIGHVHATQADGVLTSDKLVVKHGKDFNDVEKMTALGDVRISQGLRWCTSDQAVLNQRAHTVVLTGNPVCHDADDQIAGSKITVHLDSGKSEVEGVKALIFPRQSKTRDNEASADHVK